MTLNQNTAYAALGLAVALAGAAPVAVAYEAGDILVRGRVIAVDPARRTAAP